MCISYPESTLLRRCPPAADLSILQSEPRRIGKRNPPLRRHPPRPRPGTSGLAAVVDAGVGVAVEGFARDAGIRKEKLLAVLHDRLLIIHFALHNPPHFLCKESVASDGLSMSNFFTD